MADKFDPEMFLTEEGNDNLVNALLRHQDLTFNMVFKLTFPELHYVTDATDLEEFEEWFLDTYDVHECESCLKWCTDDDLKDKVCTDCLEEQHEDDDDDYDGDDEEELEKEEEDY